ncbi:MAG: hypothetical protein IJ230_04830 [Clostridia bacterium]|nr:hypothetical protein [Clostridia bacterium]
MKVSMKRLLSIALTGLMLMLCVLPVFALEQQNPVEPTVPAVPYAVIRSNSASVSVSGTKASCFAKLTSQSSAALSIKMTLQKKSGSTWSNVQSWSASKTGTSLTLSKTKTVTSGGSYRLKVTFTAGSETVSQTVYP